VGGSESESSSLAEVEWHLDSDSSHSSNDIEDDGVNSTSGSEEVGSKEEEKVEEENAGDDEQEVHDCYGLWLGNSFGLSEIAAAWEMFKSNPPHSLVASITPSQRTSLLSDFGKCYLLEKSHKTSSNVSGCVSGPDVNPSSNSRG